MNILVLGGTLLMGKHLVSKLLNNGHNVTIATRGRAEDGFGDRVSRLVLERTSNESIKSALQGKSFDVVYDSLAYSSNEVKYLLDNVKTDKYIQISTVAVYAPDFKPCITETDFDPMAIQLKWCERTDYPYDEIKRQAEAALFQEYSHIPGICVRFPYVIGEDDYTKRLQFYVDHIKNEMPMFIDNMDSQLSFVDSKEAGEFLAFLLCKDFTGSLNACNVGTLKVRDILCMIEEKTNKKAIIEEAGEKAPYNGRADISLDLTRASELGFTFTPVMNFFGNLLDILISRV